MQSNRDELMNRHFERADVSPAPVVSTAVLSGIENGREAELLGLQYLDRGEVNAARSALELAATLVPLSVDGIFGLAQCYIAAQQRTLAVSWLRTLLDSRHAEPHQLLNAARQADSLDDPFSAVRLCREAVRRDLDFAQAFFELGYFLARCGQPFHIVEAQARRAIHLDPRCFTYRMSLAALLWKHEQRDSACELIREITDEEMQSVRCGNCLKRVLEMLNHAGNEHRIAACQEIINKLPPDAFTGC